MEDFDFFYQIYVNYRNILNIIKKINKIIINKNMKNEEHIPSQIENFYDEFEDCSFNLSNVFNRINKAIKTISEDNKQLKMEVETIKKECETLKIENKRLNERVRVLEKGYKDLKEHLKCPITECTMSSPVITPYGFTYEENEIKNWLKKSNTDPMCRNPLAEEQLVKNIGLKKVIETCDDIKKQEEKNNK